MWTSCFTPINFDDVQLKDVPSTSAKTVPASSTNLWQDSLLELLEADENQQFILVCCVFVLLLQIWLYYLHLGLFGDVVSGLMLLYLEIYEDTFLKRASRKHMARLGHDSSLGTYVY